MDEIKDFVPVKTRSGGEASLAADEVRELGDSLRGRLLRPGDDGYGEARSLWNAMIDRRPALFRAATPFATGGVYVNFLTQEEQDRIQLAYQGNYDRLRKIKAVYDPTNLFRHNQNIRPA